MEKLAQKFQVHIKSEIPESYFRLHLSCSPIHTQVDAGCIQEDCIDVNFEKTFQKLEEFFSRSEKLIARETRWLQENEIDLILSDAASLPLKAGRALGIPTVLICNFTWHDIYSRFPGAEKRREILDSLKEEYSLASLQILPQCHIVNDVIQNKREVGWIARKGKTVRRQLERDIGVSFKGKTIVFIYLGDTGTASVQWKNLKKLNDFIFITRDPIANGPPNLSVLDDRFLYQDLIATSDVVCTKAGYSTLAAAFAHGKPALSCSRRDFSEFEAVRDYMRRKRVGLIMNSKKFFACDWEEDIREALTLSVAGKTPLDGEKEVLKIINSFLQS